MKLGIEKEYNLNNIKEIRVTEELITKNVTNCNYEESFDDCRTRKLIASLYQECACLPYSISAVENKV